MQPLKDPYSVIAFPAVEILTHAQDVEAEALADGLIHQLVGQAVKPHVSSQGDCAATFTLIWEGRRRGEKMKMCLKAIWVLPSHANDPQARK